MKPEEAKNDYIPLTNWPACSLCKVQVNEELHSLKIFWSAPLQVNAKGPFRREQPSGLVTTEVATSLRTTWKWGPQRPRWFTAKRMKRMVAEEVTGQLDRLSLEIFAFSAIRREKLELLAWLDKHDFVSPETITQSIAASFIRKPLPWATTPPSGERKRKKEIPYKKGF